MSAGWDWLAVIVICVLFALALGPLFAHESTPAPVDHGITSIEQVQP